MIDRQEVTFVFLETLLNLNQKRYNLKEGKLYWLQAMLFWALDRLNPEMPAVKELRVNTDSLMKRLIAQNRHLVEMYHKNECQCLLIGRKQFKELSLETMPSSPQWFSFHSRYKYAHFSEDFQMWIVVIPWMDGMLLIPKDLFK